MACPECGGQMKVIAFLEPPQADVIEKILRHGEVLSHGGAGATARTAIRTATRPAPTNLGS